MAFGDPVCRGAIDRALGGGVGRPADVARAFPASAPGADLGPWMAKYFDAKEELERLFGREVDLVEKGPINLAAHGLRQPARGFAPPRLSTTRPRADR
jgi:hypothetical protein